MLVLSREIGESIVITTEDGTEVELTVLAVDANGRKVSLGFKAPRSVQIDRHEIYLEKKHENIEASKVTAAALDRFRRDA